MRYNDPREIIAELYNVNLQLSDNAHLYSVFEKLNLVFGGLAAEKLMLDRFGLHSWKVIRRAFANYYGDARAHALIDQADAEYDLHRAILLLRRALQYGHLGIQARKAYRSLGVIYDKLGQLDRARYYYSMSDKTAGKDSQ